MFVTINSVTFIYMSNLKNVFVKTVISLEGLCSIIFSSKYYFFIVYVEELL